MILAVLAIGRGALVPEAPSDPSPSTTTAAAPDAGHGIAAGVPSRTDPVRNTVGAIAGKGRNS